MTAAPVRLGILGTVEINEKHLAGTRLTNANDVVAVSSRTVLAGGRLR